MTKRNLIATAIFSLALIFTTDTFGQRTSTAAKSRNRNCPSPMCGGRTNPVTRTSRARYANLEVSYLRGGGEVAMESVDLLRSVNAPFDKGYLPPAVTNRGTATQMVFEPNDEPLWLKGRRQTRSTVSPNSTTVPTPKKPKRWHGDIGEGTGI